MLAFFTPGPPPGPSAWWILALVGGIGVLAAVPIVLLLARRAGGGMVAGAAATTQLAAGVLLLVAHARRPIPGGDESVYVLRGYGAVSQSGNSLSSVGDGRTWLAWGLVLVVASALTWTVDGALRARSRTVNGPSSAEVSA